MVKPWKEKYYRGVKCKNGVKKVNGLDYLTPLILYQKELNWRKYNLKILQFIGCFPNCTGVIFWTQSNVGNAKKQVEKIIHLRVMCED